MLFEKVRELRQSGKLEEAEQMVIAAMQTEPANIWNKRAASWVYFDYLKKYAKPEHYDLFNPD